MERLGLRRRQRGAEVCYTCGLPFGDEDGKQIGI
jgi:hypothetical protein